jgi:hydrocephalus-inducing protein
MFQFDVKKGTLSVGAKTPINITFSSSIPGEFKETFRFRLEGSTELLSILFSGHVIAPTFSFDKEIIDFGKVSYSFPEQKTIKLTNTSDVPFVYNLRIPGDGKLT